MTIDVIAKVSIRLVVFCTIQYSRQSLSAKSTRPMLGSRCNNHDTARHASSSMPWAGGKALCYRRCNGVLLPGHVRYSTLTAVYGSVRCSSLVYFGCLGRGTNRPEPKCLAESTTVGAQRSNVAVQPPACFSFFFLEPPILLQ